LRNFFFFKSIDKIQVLLKSDNNNGHSDGDQCTYYITSRSLALRMVNVSGKRYTDNQNTFYVQ